MHEIWEISRRRFLWLLGALGILRAANPVAPVAADRVSTLAPGFQVMEAHEVATLEAVSEQIIPGDSDPGARAAGVVHYIDRVLVSEQREKRWLYTAGLAGTDETSRTMFGRPFIQLEFDQQTAVLKAIEQGQAEGEIWKKVSSKDFFSTVWNHTLEGFYGPPNHGGNKGYASWKMVGFPEHSGSM